MLWRESNYWSITQGIFSSRAARHFAETWAAENKIAGVRSFSCNFVGIGEVLWIYNCVKGLVEVPQTQRDRSRLKSGIGRGKGRG